MNNFIAQLLNNNNNNQLGLNQIFPTFTSTVFQTTTLTVTTPSIVSCISKNQFASTQPCSRKRRGAYVDEIEAIEAFVALAATPVEPLVNNLIKYTNFLNAILIKIVLLLDWRRLWDPILNHYKMDGAQKTYPKSSPRRNYCRAVERRASTTASNETP